MKKNISYLMAIFAAFFSFETNATKGELLKHAFTNLMQLARATSGNGLTELPRSTLRDYGARYVGEIEDIVGATVKRVGLERTCLELPGSTTDKIIKDSKEEWDAQLEDAEASLKMKAVNANRKIQQMHREYEDLLKFGSSS